MSHYLCTVRIGGSPLHEVVDKRVSIPEIGVLRAIHGDDAVRDVRYADAPEGENLDDGFNIRVARNEFNDADERMRLYEEYEKGLPENQEGLIGRLYPTFSALPRRLSQIGMDTRSQAEAKRVSAAKLLEEADTLELADEEAAEPPATA